MAGETEKGKRSPEDQGAVRKSTPLGMEPILAKPPCCHGLQSTGWMRTPEPVEQVELVYARDTMAQPLRDLNKVLEQVRSGEFNPDATRSGYFRSPGPAQEDEQQVLSSSSKGSEDEEDPEHEQFEKA